MLNRQRTIAGKLHREIQRKTADLPEEINAMFNTLSEQISRLFRQQVKHKLYALDALEVECISKGKAKNTYEFGVKSSLAVTHKCV